jgi:hypothetical protein
MSYLKHTALLFITLVLPATLLGCGKHDTQSGTAQEAGQLCAALKDAGFTGKCTANSVNNTLGIAIDTDDVKAIYLCPDIANRIKPSAMKLAGQWKLQILSPYRDDKPLGDCVLH